MWWNITYRVIASVVTFLIGCAVFAIATDELPLAQSKLPIESITLAQIRCSVTGQVHTGQECNVLIVTFRSDGTCNYVRYVNGDHVLTFTGDFNPQDLPYLIKEINKQGSLELPLALPKSELPEETSIEVVNTDGTRSVATYNWSIAPLAYERCNLY